MDTVLKKAKQKLLDLQIEERLLSAKKGELESNKQIAENKLLGLKEKVTYLHISKKILQEVVERVSKDNLEKVESFVNRALTLIFPDLSLSFKIEQDVKRGNNTYSFAVYQGSIKGSIHSFGGGVIAVIAVVLKILFNIITKRFPLLALDETLSFLAVNYIPAMSDFLKTVSKEFGIPIILVTHQPQFASAADFCYIIDKAEQTTIQKESI